MNGIVVVHGPAACGKTRNAEALRVKFGCQLIVDGWNLHDERAEKQLRDGRGRRMLLLTNENPDLIRHRFPAAKIVAFKEAIR